MYTYFFGCDPLNDVCTMNIEYTSYLVHVSCTNHCKIDLAWHCFDKNEDGFISKVEFGRMTSKKKLSR